MTRSAWKKYLSLLVLAASGGIVCNSSAADFVLGVGTHFAQNRGDPAKTLSMMQAAGIMSFRDDMAWPAVERKRDELTIAPDLLGRLTTAIDAARSAGVEPLLTLSYGNRAYGGGYPLTPEARDGFARYAKFVATTFAGKVRYFEVWNEWNGGSGDARAAESARAPDGYVELLKRVYPAIKQANPSAIVLGGAVEGAGHTDWIEGMLRNGAADFMDGLSVHPYVYHQGRDGTPERLWAWLARLQTRFDSVVPGKAIPLYITEIGWPTVDRGVSPTDAADYVVRTYLIVRTFPSIRGLWWYEFQNGGNRPGNGEDNFGLVDTKMSPKPAYSALVDIAHTMAEATRVERLFPQSRIWAVQITGSGGGRTLAIWDPSGDGSSIELKVRAGGTGTVTVQRTGGDRSPADQVKLQAGENTLRLKATGSPLLINAGNLQLDAVDLNRAAQ